MDSRFLPVFRTGPLPARNDITGQRWLVESEFCQRITQHLQFPQKRESIFSESHGLPPSRE